MTSRHVIVAIVAAALSGCAGTDGLYAPACATFEGEAIELDGGRFVVHRFTDTVEFDDDGSVINQFPGYPIHGKYEVEGNVLHMRADDGTEMPRRYLARVGSEKWLLSQSEYEEWTRDGSIGPCTLVRGDRRSQ